MPIGRYRPFSPVSESCSNILGNVGITVAALLPVEIVAWSATSRSPTSAGVACDLLVVAERPCGLESLAKLAEGSGGVLYHYADGAEGAAVPQDVFRLLSREAALGATLRLRTSCEFKVARAYGHLAADGDVDELYHAVCLDEHSTFMFDFEFVEAEGFDYDVAPTVQLAIRYSLLVPVRPAGGGVVDEYDANGARSHAGENGGVGSRGGAVAGFRVERRLRIVTAQARVAKRAKALYDSARCDVVMALLTHKIILASRAEGVPEARLLLREPLLYFLLAGAALFYLADALGGDTQRRIVVSDAERARLSAQWQAQMGRPPTEAELAALIEQWIREEIYYREAVAMGLDEDDVILADVLFDMLMQTARGPARDAAKRTMLRITDPNNPESIVDKHSSWDLSSPLSFLSLSFFSFSRYLSLIGDVHLSLVIATN